MDASFAMRSLQKPSRARAVTLIELMVVISVIAVLVSILLPSLSRARLQSQRVACASNQKQIQNEITVYSSDQKGHIPYDVPYFNASLTGITWQEFGVPPFPPKGWVHLGLLYGARQIRDPKIFFCPACNEFPHVYPRGWNEFSIRGGIERGATAYVCAIGGKNRKCPKGQRTTARLDEFRKRELLFSCVFVGKVDKRQKSRVWPRRGGINADFTDGSVQLARVEPALANTAAELYARNLIDEMDYLTCCFFRLLSGELVWMRVYPRLPPGHSRVRATACAGHLVCAGSSAILTGHHDRAGRARVPTHPHHQAEFLGRRHARAARPRSPAPALPRGPPGVARLDHLLGAP